MDEKFKEYERKRARIYRQRKSLLKSVDLLAKKGQIEGEEIDSFRKKLKECFRELVESAKQLRAYEVRKRGRPWPSRSAIAPCGRAGCEKLCQPGKDYCSAEHAPLAFYELAMKGEHHGDE